MSVMRTRVVAAVAVLGAAALSVASAVSMTHADEPKAPTPRPQAPSGPRAVPGGAALPGDDFQKAQDQLLRAMEGLANDPTGAEARKRVEEAQRALMAALGGGLPPHGLAFPHADRPLERPRLGVRLEPLSPLVTDQLGLEPGKGVAVAGVVAGSAAEKAGFKVHDIVVEFAGKLVADSADFPRQVNAVKAGDSVAAVVLRKGKRVELKGIVLPEVPRDAFALPINPRAVEDGRGGDSVSVSVTDGVFTINAVRDGVSYLISGKAGTDGATAAKVNIKAGDDVVDAGSLDQVPEKYRATVDELLKLVGKRRPKVRD
jgi:membrane-associated protease RseP (regulator of RpoE activity)